MRVCLCFSSTFAHTSAEHVHEGVGRAVIGQAVGRIAAAAATDRSAAAAAAGQPLAERIEQQQLLLLLAGVVTVHRWRTGDAEVDNNRAQYCPLDGALSGAGVDMCARLIGFAGSPMVVVVVGWSGVRLVRRHRCSGVWMETETDEFRFTMETKAIATSVCNCVCVTIHIVAQETIVLIALRIGEMFRSDAQERRVLNGFFSSQPNAQRQRSVLVLQRRQNSLAEPTPGSV